MPSLRVIYRSSVFAGRELTLDQAVVRIGRDPSCHITFDEKADRIVSRQHCEIRFDGNSPVVYPNGPRIILIGGQRVDGPTPLTPGDILELAGPGGPSFEVQFEGHRPRAVIGNEPVDSSARTLFEMHVPRSELAAAAAAHDAARDPTPAPYVPAETAVSPPVTPAPQLALMSAAPVLRAVPVSEATIAPVPPPEVPSTPGEPARSYSFARVLIVLGFVAVSAGSLWLAWAAPHAGARAPPPQAARDTTPSRPIPAGKSAEKAAAPPAAPALTEASLPAPDPAVRHAYAAVRRAELAVESAPSPIPGLQEQLKQATQAYEAALKDRAGDYPKTDTMKLIRATARRLGECDGAIPVGFITDAQAAIEHFASDADAGRQLAESIARAHDAHDIQGITDLLAAEGLPAELVLIPLDASGFRADMMAMPQAGLVAKGLWQLLPSEAKRMGLKLGPRASQLGADPTDERLQFAVESQKVAKSLVPVYFGTAGGSKLLLMATYDHGSEDLLRTLKEEAGLKPDESDPEQVSYWRLYESGALTEAVKKHALDMFVLTAATSKPTRFNLDFEPLFQ